MRVLATAAAIVATAALLPSDSAAWESTTTSAGVIEQGALASRLHLKLSEQLGAKGGLYSRLRVPRADAKSLFAVLDKLNPVHGYVPGSKGRQLAIGWLTAGAALADIPPDFDFANNRADLCVNSLNARPDSNGDLILGIK